MKVTRRGGDLWLRIDDRAQRMVVRPATNDALAAIGWDVAHIDLDVVRAVLASSGHEVANATPDELESRGVAAMVWACDPDGNRVEFVSRPQSARGSSRGDGSVPMRFVTGELGMG